MSDKLNKELIKLYKIYKSQKKPPYLMQAIKSFLLKEGVDVGDESIGTVKK